MANVENTVKLLWDCATSLDADTHTNKLLKSYYINTCRKIAKHHLQVPKEKFAVSQMCPRCSAIWTESEFNLKLRPQRVASTGKAKKLIAKLDQAASTNKKGILSKKQRRRAKWLKKRVCSSVEIQCERCKKKSLIQLQKPSQRRLTTEPSAEEMTVQVEAPTPKTKKKKKKNKDTTAGLKIAHKHKTQQDVKITKTAAVVKKPSAINQDERISNKVASAAVTPKPQAASKTPKPLLNTNPSGSVKKKNKKKKNNATAKPHFAPTVQSETQKKNSLLQLAALLKKQSSKPETAQNRLQSLLK